MNKMLCGLCHSLAAECRSCGGCLRASFWIRGGSRPIRGAACPVAVPNRRGPSRAGGGDAARTNYGGRTVGPTHWAKYILPPIAKTLSIGLAGVQGRFE